MKRNCKPIFSKGIAIIDIGQTFVIDNGECGTTNNVNDLTITS